MTEQKPEIKHLADRVAIEAGNLSDYRQVEAEARRAYDDARRGATQAANRLIGARKALNEALDEAE